MPDLRRASRSRQKWSTFARMRDSRGSVRRRGRRLAQHPDLAFPGGAAIGVRKSCALFAANWRSVAKTRSSRSRPDERGALRKIVTAAGVSAGIDLALWLAPRWQGVNRRRSVPPSKVM
jgi:hypothetical protein